jgi:hypothetical protein
MLKTTVVEAMPTAKVATAVRTMSGERTICRI